MATGSKGGRSYSDPSYGSIKTLSFGVVTAGTRATAIVDGFTPMNPITVIDWSMANTTLGTGGSSQWVLAATSANGTSALGTIIFVGTHAAGAEVSGSIATEATIPTGGALHLYSVLSTAASLTVRATVSYREAFDASDN
jgi:hypothetical protein